MTEVTVQQSVKKLQDKNHCGLGVFFSIQLLASWLFSQFLSGKRVHSPLDFRIECVSGGGVDWQVGTHSSAIACGTCVFIQRAYCFPTSCVFSWRQSPGACLFSSVLGCFF